MANQSDTKEKDSTTERPPIVTVLGHVDHGKSTLLDKIRQTGTERDEAGGITQHIAAYEVTHKKDEEEKKITFIDTPGHAAFGAMRSRGADVADVAILVVAADDGVQPQTLEAYEAIKESETPLVIAINKMDLPTADAQKTITSLIENEIYPEGFGGDIPVVEVSAKTGEQIDDLLDIILLIAELEELVTDPSQLATGVVIEAKISARAGTTATLLIRDGTLEGGQYIQAGKAWSPVRGLENFLGESINEAQASSPVRITGFNEQPVVGAEFHTFTDRSDARDAADNFEVDTDDIDFELTEDAVRVPIVIKTDVSGTAEAIIHEIRQTNTDRAQVQVVHTGVGTISENDVRIAGNQARAIVIGFNVKTDASARELAKRTGVEIKTANIIYELAEWLAEAVKERTPTIEVEEVTGRAKVLQTFSKQGSKQVIGGKVAKGNLKKGASLRVMRNSAKIGTGMILGLQEQKVATDEVSEGREFGTQVDASVEIAPGDLIESFILVEK